MIAANISGCSIRRIRIGQGSAPVAGPVSTNATLNPNSMFERSVPGAGSFFISIPKLSPALYRARMAGFGCFDRNIEPSWGSWTFPGGYVDLGECVPDAAIRETYEETRLNIRLDGLLNLYSYANVGVVLAVYRATVIGGVAAATPESQEVRAFRLEDIPWEKLAFPSTREALQDYAKLEQTPCGQK